MSSVNSFGFDVIHSTKLLGQQLEYLGWFGTSEETFFDMMYSFIDYKIEHACSKRFDVSILERLLEWATLAVLPWLKELLIQKELMLSRYNQWKARVNFHIYKAFGNLRINELFDIVKEYPDSVPSLSDLNQCLKRTLQQKELISKFKESLKERLLQPGVQTSQIIDMYILTIKVRFK